MNERENKNWHAEILIEVLVFKVRL